jgi:hypothetical protein
LKVSSQSSRLRRSAYAANVASFWGPYPAPEKRQARVFDHIGERLQHSQMRGNHQRTDIMHALVHLDMHAQNVKESKSHAGHSCSREPDQAHHSTCG